MKRFRELTFVTPNKPGSIAKVLNAIARENINVSAIDSSAGFDLNVVRIITEDAARTRAVLEKFGYAPGEETVLGLQMPDRPGQLAKMAAALGEAKINIDYLYAASSSRDHEAIVICHVSNLDAAERVLKEAGVEVELVRV